MELKITHSSDEAFRVGDQVSLSNNGTKLRIFNLNRVKARIEIIDPEITAHMEDEKTSLQICGYVIFNRAGETTPMLFERIYLSVE
jgi:hypothetical protein